MTRLNAHVTIVACWRSHCDCIEGRGVVGVEGADVNGDVDIALFERLELELGAGKISYGSCNEAGVRLGDTC